MAEEMLQFAFFNVFAVHYAFLRELGIGNQIAIVPKNEN